MTPWTGGPLRKNGEWEEQLASTPGRQRGETLGPAPHFPAAVQNFLTPDDLHAPGDSCWIHAIGFNGVDDELESAALAPSPIPSPASALS